MRQGVRDQSLSPEPREPLESGAQLRIPHDETPPPPPPQLPLYSGEEVTQPSSAPPPAHAGSAEQVHVLDDPFGQRRRSRKAWLFVAGLVTGGMLLLLLQELFSMS